MSFSEREIQEIHRNTSFKDGQKYFGKYDSLVESKTTTEIKIGNEDTTTETTILIPLMERSNKLDIFINSLLFSIVESQQPISLIFLDNSLENNLVNTIDKKDFGSRVVKVIYHHNPRMIQSTGRNFAYDKLVGECPIIGLWDSDIYPNISTIKGILKTLSDNEDVSGIAPPMGKFNKEPIKTAYAHYTDIKNNKDARLELHMPGAIGEENGIWKSNILRTAIMRGCYFIRKNLAEKIASQNANKKPWLEDFVVWQNVPFFVAARELKQDFGYVMEGDLVVLHDDNYDSFSVSTSAEYRISETLKSMMLIMYRNRIFNSESKEINGMFLRYNNSAIAKLTGLDIFHSNVLQEELLQLAKVLYESNNLVEFNRGYSNEVNPILKPVLKLISDESTFRRVKSIRSINESKPIYTI